MAKPFFREGKTLLCLALPLVGSGIVESSLNFFSTMFLAKVSSEALAAGALVNWIFATLVVIIWGGLSAVSTLIAHHHGAEQPLAVARVLRDSLFLAVALSLPCMLLIWHLDRLLLWLNQDPQIIALAIPYVHSLTWAVFPDLVFTVCLQFIIGLGYTKMNLLFTLFWVSSNLLLNYAFIFGAFGLPALGIAGIGWGTTIAFWLVALLIILYLMLHKDYHFYRQHLIHNAYPSRLKELIQLGLPMGFMFCIEVGFFTLMTLLMGTISSVALAANQVALQFSTHLSVVSFSIANAITIRMGHLLGAKEPRQARLVGYLGIMMAVIFMALIALIYFKFPRQLIGLDFDLSLAKNQAVVAAAEQILVISALFQIFDSIRITAFGALRALKDTRFTLGVSLLSFGLIAIPLAYLMAVKLNFQTQGVWWVMVGSQLFAAFLLIRRYRQKTKSVTVSPLPWPQLKVAMEG